MRRLPVLLLLLLAQLLPTAAHGASREAAAARDSVRAAGLYQQALEQLSRNDVDSRRKAIQLLEQATLQAPGESLYELTLARAYYAAGFRRYARERYERVSRSEPRNLAGHLGLGLVWKRDWLKYLDARSLDRAIDEFSVAARLDSTGSEALLLLVPLLLERGSLREASQAAFTALKRDPNRLEARLAVASAAWRAGLPHEADSLFAVTVPLLRRSVRSKFLDISPVASAQDTALLNRLPRREQEDFTAGFWRRNDPDLTTPENEARLEYWARVTQAYFLFFDERRDGWDERGEVYVRYGPPASFSYNPVGQRLSFNFATGLDYPANLLVWDYPELGMRVSLQDRLLSEYYMLPVSRTVEMDPVPDPAVVGAADNAFAMPSGRGVFHLLPPGSRPLLVRMLAARFEAAGRPRLLVQLEVPGGPADSLWAEWVVTDAEGGEESRAARPLSPSACDAESRRVADFASELPPGLHTVGVTVSDGRGGRGIVRQSLTLPAPLPVVSLSDLVIACGTPDVVSGPNVRVEPNPSRRVPAAGPLSAYFEIYHLSPDRDGLGRFEYVYSVRSLARDERAWITRVLSPLPKAPTIAVSREERNAGPLRRQFISVPVAALPAGPYRLEVKVRDLVGGGEASAAADFVKLPAPPPR